MKKLQVKINGEWLDYTAPRVDMVTFSDSTEDVRLIDQDECSRNAFNISRPEQPEIEELEELDMVFVVNKINEIIRYLNQD